MADISQVAFTLKEVTTALIKRQGIHEGKWIVGFEFSMAAGNVASSPTDARPAAIVGISAINLQRVRDGQPPLPFQVDAAEENPAS